MFSTTCFQRTAEVLGGMIPARKSWQHLNPDLLGHQHRYQEPA